MCQGNTFTTGLVNVNLPTGSYTPTGGWLLSCRCFQFDATHVPIQRCFNLATKVRTVSKLALALFVGELPLARVRTGSEDSTSPGFLLESLAETFWKDRWTAAETLVSGQTHWSRQGSGRGSRAFTFRTTGGPNIGSRSILVCGMTFSHPTPRCMGASLTGIRLPGCWFLLPCRAINKAIQPEWWRQTTLTLLPGSVLPATLKLLTP